jgi:acyl-coenzyme A thioesterase PaaI-like protein
LGDLVEATGEVVRAGGSLIFLRGLISTGGRPVMTFSGVVKRVRRG